MFIDLILPFCLGFPEEQTAMVSTMKLLLPPFLNLINKMHSSLRPPPILYLQNKGFIPDRIKGGPDGSGLLLCEILWVRNQLEFHIRIRETIWIHRNQVQCFSN